MSDRSTASSSSFDVDLRLVPCEVRRAVVSSLGGFGATRKVYSLCECAHVGTARNTCEWLASCRERVCSWIERDIATMLAVELDAMNWSARGEKTISPLARHVDQSIVQYR
jgi:hypothetical protein